MTVKEHVDNLELRPDDPPVFVMVIPPFSTAWIDRMQGIGARTVTDEMRQRLDSQDGPIARRAIAWEASRQVAIAAEAAGCAGTILMGLRFDTIVDEAALNWSSVGRE